MVPKRKCTYYDPFTHDTCMDEATHIVSHDDGEPGETGVLSTYRCTSHIFDCTVRKAVPYAAWYCMNILGIEPQRTAWDLL